MDQMRISFRNTDGSAVMPWQKITRAESGFHEVHPPKYTVFTFQVDFGGGHAPFDPPSVVKLSERQNAIPHAETLKLGTLAHYRQLEEAADGIGDEMEGRFNQDLSGFLSKSDDTRLDSLDGVSGTVTWQAGEKWVYCTSVEPSSNSVLRRMKETFGADYITRIAKPSDFAIKLGNAVGGHVQWADLRRASRQRLIHMLQVAEGYERIVHVYHGRVLYTDEGIATIETLNELEKSVAACFIKRTKYAWQQEYRFAVSVGAELDPEPLFVPVSPGLKDLAVAEDAKDS